MTRMLTSTVRVGLFVLFALASLPPTVAQEEAEQPEGDASSGRISFSVEGWIAQPAGLEYRPSYRLDATEPQGTDLIEIGSDTSTEFRYELGFRLPGNWGRIAASYYNSHTATEELQEFDPGNFLYGELQVDPQFAGFDDQGLADGFRAQTATRLKDMRLDYYRPAFRSARAYGEWFIGWRRVSHSRSMDTAYYGLVTGIPPVIPPISGGKVDLTQEPDQGSMSSEYEGRGLSAGLNVDIPLYRDKVLLKTGFTLSVLRGKTDAHYGSTTRYYLASGDTILDYTNLELLNLCNSSSGPVECDNPNAGGSIGASTTIEDFLLGIDTQSESTTSNVIDAHIAVHWKIFRWFDLYGGFRMARYDNVGLDLELTSRDYDPTNPTPARIEDFAENSRSATYEGFYLGLGFTFF